ncbi:hypothetical protein [Acutalibacter intestini]|nr:hypothetical protein [Acutalibacter sp. M00204]
MSALLAELGTVFLCFTAQKSPQQTQANEPHLDPKNGVRIARFVPLL